MRRRRKVIKRARVHMDEDRLMVQRTGDRSALLVIRAMGKGTGLYWVLVEASPRGSNVPEEPLTMTPYPCRVDLGAMSKVGVKRLLSYWDVPKSMVNEYIRTTN